MKEQRAGATVKGYSKEVENGIITFEAEMTVKGHGKDVSFDPSGKVVSIEEEVRLDSIRQVPARRFRKRWVTASYSRWNW